MKVEFLGFSWIAAEYIWLFPVIIVILFLCVWHAKRTSAAWNYLVSNALHKQLLSHASRVRLIIKTSLFFLGIIFLFLAFLRPALPKKEKTVLQEGRDLFIALDISRSMLATDCEPSRLVCAKEKIRRLLSFLGCERVGLILFSGSALVQCPLTTDYSAFFMFLDQVDAETISSGTTAIDKAIGRALDAFASTPEKKTKLLVLFTDGEDFSSNLKGIKKKAVESGMNIFTIGIGTPEGAPIPLYDESGKQKGHQLDKRGKVVITRLNEGILQSLSEDSGGSYLRFMNDDSDLRNLVNKIETFEKEKFDDKKMELYEELYPYAVVVSFFCFLFEWML